MYNGIGLTTPRGSGTSGYVQRNLSAVRNRKERVDYKSEEELKKLDSMLAKQPNPAILDHEKKRRVELRVVELQDLMEEQGYSPEEIEMKVAAFREMLAEQEEVLKEISSEKTDHKRVAPTETHQLAEANQEKNARLREAFGISKYFVEGSSFDPKHKEREAAAEKAENEKKYQLIHSPSRSPSPNKLSKKKKKKEKDRQKELPPLGEHRKPSSKEPSMKKQKKDKRYLARKSRSRSCSDDVNRTNRSKGRFAESSSLGKRFADMPNSAQISSHRKQKLGKESLSWSPDIQKQKRHNRGESRQRKESHRRHTSSDHSKSSSPSRQYKRPEARRRRSSSNERRSSSPSTERKRKERHSRRGSSSKSRTSASSGSSERKRKQVHKHKQHRSSSSSMLPSSRKCLTKGNSARVSNAKREKSRLSHSKPLSPFRKKNEKERQKVSDAEDRQHYARKGKYKCSPSSSNNEPERHSLRTNESKQLKANQLHSPQHKRHRKSPEKVQKLIHSAKKLRSKESRRKSSSSESSSSSSSVSGPVNKKRRYDSSSSVSSGQASDESSSSTLS